MGQSRSERTWRTPRTTRHVWVRMQAKHPHEPPRQGLVVQWRHHEHQWEAMVCLVDDQSDGDPVVVMRWIPISYLRPVPADPNRAFGLR